ncbi:uncharacterized protein LOC143042458 isoform X3 [Mytilus galloprovincialis]|uniref:uncharacterized protein LOC143042458 isoform X3 n=1 Tax=Mytilus galloprovincialis TaxID=29158 RepID=UPI003F7C70FF
MKTQIMSLFVLFILTILQIINIHGSHFQGGLITWKYKDDKVYITYKLSFTDRSCDSTAIFNKTLINVGGSFTCYQGCDGTLMSSLSYQCTDYSVDENWKYGQRTVNVTFPSTPDNFYAFGYSSCCWVNLVEGGNNWLLLATANLSIRQDNKRINSSPISSMQPVTTLKQNCSYALKIPVQDEDNDVVRCRWASSPFMDECGGVCSRLNHTILDQNNCILYINTTVTTGNYAFAIQIEDFLTHQDTLPLSSIPLQFIVHVNDNISMCDEKPSIETTGSLGSMIVIPANRMYQQTIVALSINSVISEINTVSPLGMFKSELYPYGLLTDRWYVNVTWTPTTKDIGIHIFCYTAIDVDRGSRMCI